MNASAQYTINTQCAAYRFGLADAQENKPCVPEMVFVARRDQVLYATGYEAHSGPTFATVQFTGSELPKPVVVPNLKRNSDREYTRRTDGNVAKIFKVATARSKWLEQCLERTAAANPRDAGDLLWI